MQSALESDDLELAFDIWRNAQIERGLPDTNAYLYRAAKVDGSEFYKLLRGELKRGGKVERRIRRFLLLTVR